MDEDGPTVAAECRRRLGLILKSDLIIAATDNSDPVVVGKLARSMRNVIFTKQHYSLEPGLINKKEEVISTHFCLVPTFN